MGIVRFALNFRPVCGFGAIASRWRRLKNALFDPYRPELHYMRGPGPKWRQKRAPYSDLVASQFAEAPMTFVPGLAPLALLSLAIADLPAAHDVQVGTALVCDTQQQVERFVTVYDGDAEMAVSAVNAEVHDASACAMASIAYVVSPPLATTRSRDATFQIVRILVIGAITKGGLQSVSPTEFFSVLPVDEREA